MVPTTLFVLEISILVYFCAAQFDQDLTLQSVFGHLSGKKARSLIQCWSKEHNPSLISFERPGGLPRYSQQLLQGNEANVLMMPSTGGPDRAGIIFCQLETGGINTKVATLKLPPSSKAQVLPLKAYVVAYAGDTVRLGVTKREKLKEPLVWRFGGMELPELQDQETVVLKDVELADAGLYECHYQGQRSSKLHAWIRLYIVGCPRGKYGPVCDKDCPPCRNGGICHDTWGVCVCPAGFAGPHCDIACGENRVGSECERSCSPLVKGQSASVGCAVHLFCKPDPMGCSCAPGFKGTHCSEECPTGFYGADCLQKCHCTSHSDCDPITGHCQKGCTAGWEGESCQIHVGNHTTTTTAATTDKPLCQDGYFGKDCAKECHCQNGDACDTVSGECPSSCQEGYSRPTCSECLPGRYGSNCNLTCHCWNGDEDCRPDGRCHDGCAAGWKGDYCQQGCTGNTYGPNCAYTCHCAPNSTACNPVSGECDICEKGFRGSSCQKTCSPGTYGSNCSQSCQCFHDEACDPVNGVCKCKGRHRGPLCDQSVPEMHLTEMDEMEEGQAAFVSCTVDAAPVPTIELYNQTNGELLSNVTVEEFGDDLYKATAPLPSDLSEGTYEFLCKASNEHGSDNSTVYVDIVAPPVLSSPPQVNVTADTAVVSWELGKPNRTSKRLSTIQYQVHYRVNGAMDWTTAGPWQNDTNCSVSDLLPDTEYEFVVSLRVNNASTDSSSELVAQTQVRTMCREALPDSVPKDVHAEVLSDHQLSIHWKAPARKELGCRLTGYEIHLHKDQTPTNVKDQVYHLGPDSEFLVLEHLKPDTSYRADIYPVTSTGKVPFHSSIGARTKIEVPGPVSELVMAWVNTTTALATWKVPPMRGDNIPEFQVTLRPGDVGGCGMTGPEEVYLTHSPQFLAKGLAPYSLYDVSIAVRMHQGKGEQSKLSFLTAIAAPSQAPENVRVTWATPRSLLLIWDPIPCLKAHGPSLSYKCHFRSVSTTSEEDSVANTNETKIMLDDLLPFHKYVMQVRAVNTAGPGPLSRTLTQMTAEDAPGKPEELDVDNVTQTTAQLHWKEPLDTNGVIMKYQVLVHTSEEGRGRTASTISKTVQPETKYFVLDDLIPGKAYTVSVSAATSTGLGPETVVTFHTAPQRTTKRPKQSSGVKALFVSGGPYSTIIKLLFPSSASHYEVELAKQQADWSYSTSNIAARVPIPDNVTQLLFMLGDSHYHGGFFNAPLSPSCTYRVVATIFFEDGLDDAPERLESEALVFTTPPAPVHINLRSACLYLALWFLVPTGVALGLMMVTITVLLQLTHRRHLPIAEVFEHPIEHTSDELPKPIEIYKISPDDLHGDWEPTHTLQSTFL